MGSLWITTRTARTNVEIHASLLTGEDFLKAWKKILEQGAWKWNSSSDKFQFQNTVERLAFST